MKATTTKFVRAGLATAALLMFITTGLIAQPASLNPTVKVRARAAAPAPAECDESLAPQPAPRIEVTEIPVTERARTADLQPPPARGLRDQLAEAQAAVERNDRTAFNEWLALARSTVAGYPPGGDRTAAAAAIAVYDDVGRLWDYQFASPTGAFFDATVQDGSLLAAMLRYPGYEQHIAGQTLTDANGTRFYPTRETREFLARTAAQRLERMGVRAAVAQRPPAETRVVSQPAPPPARAGTVATPSTRSGGVREPAVRSATGQRSTSGSPAPSAGQQRRRPTRKTTTAASATTTASRSSSSGSRTTSATSGRRTPAQRATANPPVTGAAASSPDEIPISSGVVNAPATATITPVEPPPVAQPSAAQPPVVSQTETAQTTETVASSTAMTTPATVPDPAPQPVKPPSRGRNLVFPLLLILIGVGVLILLFRASA